MTGILLQAGSDNLRSCHAQSFHKAQPSQRLGLLPAALSALAVHLSQEGLYNMVNYH